MVKKRTIKNKSNRKVSLRQRPLPASFLLMGLFMFAASVIYTYGGQLSTQWGATLIIFSFILVAASLRSLNPINA